MPKKSRKSLATLAKKVAKNTRILNTREFGSQRTALTVSPSTTANVLNVSPIGVGDDVSNRQGRKIQAHSIEISGTITMHATSAQTAYRLVLVKDRFGTTDNPVLGDLFIDVNDMFENQVRRETPQDHKRFQVLWDKFINLNEPWDGASPQKAFHFKKNLNFPIFFSGSAATDEGKNNLWLFEVSDEATNTPVVNAVAVFRFSDL